MEEASQHIGRVSAQDLPWLPAEECVRRGHDEKINTAGGRLMHAPNSLEGNDGREADTAFYEWTSVCVWY